MKTKDTVSFQIPLDLYRDVWLTVPRPKDINQLMDFVHEVMAWANYTDERIRRHQLKNQSNWPDFMEAIFPEEAPNG